MIIGSFETKLLRFPKIRAEKIKRVAFGERPMELA